MKKKMDNNVEVGLSSSFYLQFYGLYLKVGGKLLLNCRSLVT